MTSKKHRDEPIWIWGVPFWPYTLQETVQSVAALVEKKKPSFFITANVHYSMLTEENPDLREVNKAASFVVADGAPLVWASRLGLSPLPERVAGSDLIFNLSRMASCENYRLFLAGGAPGVAEEAACKLVARYPNLMVVGTATPSFREAYEPDYSRLKSQIHDTRPDILIIAATMPFGERWLAAHIADLGVPVSVNLGAALDFAAGRITRAPRWMQRVGLEWAFRLMLEPRRLFSRYSRNALFIARMLIRGHDTTLSKSRIQDRQHLDADLGS
jgi:N-acetylglucosaminyldiphosphoundecaprenol N-acetyl-beta-D-mannosaminyltransferase